MWNSFEKLKQSLARTRQHLVSRIARVIGGRKIDDDLLGELEQILIEADVGVRATTRLISRIKEKARERGLTDGDHVVALLQEEIAELLARQSQAPAEDGHKRPVVWLIVGVNGTGKTTTIGKLASRFSADGKKVVIAACDTFRAAAIDQIGVWAERAGVDIIRSKEGADPAAVAFDAAKAAAARQADFLLVDTAGRLHTKSNLMEELKKIQRVIDKALPGASVSTKLIIDGSTGQNAVTQLQVFKEAVGCNGIIVTKLDGTAKGGIVVAVAEELGVPVEYIGLGEGLDDLQPFDPRQFAQALFS